MDNNKIDNKVITKRNIYNDEDSGIVFLIMLVIPLVLSLLLSFVLSSIAQGREISTDTILNSKGYAIGTSIISIILYFGVFFVYNHVRKVDNKAINLNFKMGWKTYLVVIGVGILSLIGIQYFIGAFDNLLRVMKYPLDQGLFALDPTNWGNYILALVFLAIFPAIYEELIFRGMILNGLRTRFGDYISILLSALMFALMHQSLQQFLYPFILGCIMGWIALRTGSLVSSIIVHMTNNVLVVTMAFIQYQTGFSFAYYSEIFYLFAFVLLGLTFAILFLIDKLFFAHKSKVSQLPTSIKTSKYLYISFAVAVVLFLVTTILEWI